MAKIQLTIEERKAATLARFKKTCPPDLFKILEAEGDITAASKASGLSKYTITQAATKKWPIRPKVQAKIDAYLAGNPILGRPTGALDAPVGATPADDVPPLAIPPWDKKMVSVKWVGRDGKKETLKMPALIGQLFEKYGGVKNDIGKALGYSGWNPLKASIDNNKYETKLHERAYRAVNDLPPLGLPSRGNGDGYIPQPGAGGRDDNSMTLRVAICIVALNDYERLEEIASIMGGKLVTKITMGSAGWVVIYKIRDRKKLETFARLGRRDAKKIVCP